MATLHDIECVLLDTHEAARYLSIAPGTLMNWRSRKQQGPSYIKVGQRVRYRISDLQDFLDRQTVRVPK